MPLACMGMGASPGYGLPHPHPHPHPRGMGMGYHIHIPLLAWDVCGYPDIGVPYPKVWDGYGLPHPHPGCGCVTHTQQHPGYPAAVRRGEAAKRLPSDRVPRCQSGMGTTSHVYDGCDVCDICASRLFSFPSPARPVMVGYANAYTHPLWIACARE